MAFRNSAIRRSRVPAGVATGLTQNLADTVTFSDAATKAVTKASADTLTLTDATVKSPVKKPADSVTLSEAVSKTAGKAMADAVTLSDAFSRTWTILRVPADSVTLSDAAAKAVSTPKADSTTLSDAVAKRMVLAKADTLSIGDVISLAEAIILSLSDSISLADAVVKRAVLFESDVLTLSDSADAEVFVLPFDFTFSQRLVQLFGEGLEVGLYASKEIGGPPIAPAPGQPHEPSSATYTVSDGLTIELSAHDRFYFAAEVEYTVHERGKLRTKREWRYYTFVA